MTRLSQLDRVAVLFLSTVLALAAGCSSGGGVPLGPPITDFTESNPVPTLAAGFVVAARETVASASVNSTEFLTIKHNHASEELLDRLIPVMAERGFKIEIDPDRAKRMNKYHPNRAEFVDPRTSRTLFQQVPVFGAGLGSYVGSIRTDRPREAYMSVSGGCGGKDLRDGATCSIDIMVLDRNVNTIYQAKVQGSVTQTERARRNIEAAWDATIAQLPMR